MAKHDLEQQMMRRCRANRRSVPNDVQRAPHGWVPERERNLAFRTVTDCTLYRRNISLSCRQCRHVRVFDGRCRWWLFER